jgi:hypothetical protein
MPSPYLCFTFIIPQLSVAYIYLDAIIPPPHMGCFSLVPPPLYHYIYGPPLALEWQVESPVLLPQIISRFPSSPFERSPTSCLGGSLLDSTLLHLT